MEENDWAYFLFVIAWQSVQLKVRTVFFFFFFNFPSVLGLINVRVCVLIVAQTTGFCLCLVISEGQPCCHLIWSHTQSTVGKITEKTPSLAHTCTSLHIHCAQMQTHTWKWNLWDRSTVPLSYTAFKDNSVFHYFYDYIITTGSRKIWETQREEADYLKWWVRADTRSTIEKWNRKLYFILWSIVTVIIV